MRILPRLLIVLTIFGCRWHSNVCADEVKLNGHTFTVPEGFEVIPIAGPPLVDRPISAAFDENGFLYVTDSSGSNDPVEVQVETRPHRVVRLEDSNDDGIFDKSVVFADKLMFPEGALWHDGSLYVAAPPEIWKFTDDDGDGRADRREVWFDGKTLTHCANDLHGPYLGPDGWLYWCKGAYAEQTYERPGRAPWVTQAAHIFRRRPEGGPVEPVITGGMANPVDVVFTPGGERIFTTTFLTRPHAGLRDGLIHAVYGGVYGQDRPSLKDHPHTGPLMPVLDHLGAAAPCGLECLQSDQLGDGYQHNLMTCLFNMQKVTRHVLRPEGASFVSETSDFLTSDSRDFHPTDVIEDADGSLIVVDTGGWYKLCCPTSQLWKPDILGAIYRIRRKESHAIEDPRGRNIDWAALDAAELSQLLADDRQAVRLRSAQQLSKSGYDSVADLWQVLASATDSSHRTEAVWTLTKIPTSEARSAVREALDDADPTVRQAALHATSVHRDRKAVPQLMKLLESDSNHNRRAAAEALGRTGGAEQIPALLEAVKGVEDRVLEHSLIFAMIEIGDANSLQAALGNPDPEIQRAALMAWDQMENSTLPGAEVISRLSSKDPKLQETAWWIIEQHPDWAGELTAVFRKRLETGETQDLADRLATFGTNPQIQSLLGESLTDGDLSSQVQQVILDAMANVSIDTVPESWLLPLLQILQDDSVEHVPAVLNVLRIQEKKPFGDDIVQQLKAIAAQKHFSEETRMLAMTLIPTRDRKFDDDTVAFLCDHIVSDQPVHLRGLAIEVLQKTKLTLPQLQRLADTVPNTGPMELRRVIEILIASKNPDVGLALVQSLLECPSATSLRPDELQEQLASFGAGVQEKGRPVIVSIRSENAALLDKLDAILELTKQADIRNGQRIFDGQKASCSACHAAGYVGGRIGPGLMRIGRIRTERDLLEAILFPSASFVQSYEPVTIVTTDGRVYNGLVKEESNDRLELQLDARKTVTIKVSDIEERREGTISIMPAGLDKQLTLQELADLVAFLKSAE